MGMQPWMPECMIILSQTCAGTMKRQMQQLVPVGDVLRMYFAFVEGTALRSTLRWAGCASVHRRSHKRRMTNEARPRFPAHAEVST
jgi:hypothetical protein